MLQIAVVEIGIQGLSGPPNTLALGTVQTGAPGAPGSVEITGNAPDQVLNLVLPVAAPVPIPAGLTTLLEQLTTNANSGLRIVTNGTGGAELAIYNPDLATWVPVRLKGIGSAQALDFVSL